MIRTIRGAITVSANETEHILSATEEMLCEIIEQNNLEISQIISILFTMTNDLTKVYPAVAARRIGIVNASLMCAGELFVEGCLPMCVRVMFTIETDKPQETMQHVYLKEAKKLRPDLATFEAIAIDGPSGCGKSTAAKIVAQKLGFTYIDTGAMYRTVALNCLNLGADMDDAAQLEQTLANVQISISHTNVAQDMYLNGENVTEQIRTQKVAEGASKVAVNLKVREFLVGMQRRIAKGTNVIMDGRDIGTYVLPKARVKIYLTATAEERGKRRFLELLEKGINADLATIVDEVRNRDYRDSNREHSPLKQAEGAILIDSTNMAIEEVCDKIICALKSVT